MKSPILVFALRALSAFWITLVAITAIMIEMEVPYEGQGMGITVFLAFLMIFPAAMVLKFVKSAPVEDA